MKISEFVYKYKDNTSDEILKHLKRNFIFTTTEIKWMEEPIKSIVVENKNFIVKGNKKFLVNKIYSIIKDNFLMIEEKVIRRTIKKYLDGIFL